MYTAKSQAFFEIEFAFYLELVILGLYSGIIREIYFR